MAPFNNGTGGTISGITTLEDWLLAHINFLRIQQGRTDRNPSNLRYLNITANTDGAISGSFNCPVTVAAGAAGATLVTATDYLTGVVYAAPSGGDSSAANAVQALIDAVRRQKAIELDTARNSSNANYLSWAVSMGATGAGTNNAMINIGFSGLPVDMVQNTNGSVTFEGRTYLT